MRGDQQAQCDEGAGRQDGEQEALVIGQHMQHELFGFLAEDQVDAGQQRALSGEFAHAAQHHQHRRQAEAHRDGVDHAVQGAVLRGEGIGARQHDAVGGDERNENPQHQIERMHKRVHQQIDHRDQRSDDQHKHRDADFVRDEMAHA